MVRAEPVNMVTAATNNVALAVLRVGFGLMTAAAASDELFAALAGADAGALAIGLVLLGCAAVGLARPVPASRLLRGRGRVLLPIGLFAVAGACDSGVQTHFAEVAPTIVWIAVIVASPRFVATCVAAAAAGYAADFVVHGHSLAWIVVGPGRVPVTNELVELAANAGVMLVLVAILRRFLARSPGWLEEVRAGGPSLTPQLALAAQRAPAGLPRADPRALIEQLSAAERRVVALLTTGRAPKQAARDLGVAVATVRTQIAAAKRKSGARTVEQLVALFAEASRDD